uniref:Uncharacterized protein n=1 Tax=Mycena chlorophos TaxID=658473 RepID=A0ABQ0L6F5_MYCCL|nr:predicted protein [Mycena chlorophos]
MSKTNKPRLYITYYWRNPDMDPSSQNTGEFHTGLLMTPKKPDRDGNSRDCLIFHAKDRLQPHMEVKEWLYQATEMKYRTRTSVALLYLGKVQDTEALQELLNTVPVNPRNEPDWKCRQWTDAALNALFQQVQNASSGQVPVFSPSKGVSFQLGSGRTIRKAGWDFARAQLKDRVENRELRPTAQIPICDQDGEQLSSYP